MPLFRKKPTFQQTYNTYVPGSAEEQLENELGERVVAHWESRPDLNTALAEPYAARMASTHPGFTGHMVLLAIASVLLRGSVLAKGQPQTAEQLAEMAGGLAANVDTKTLGEYLENFFTTT